MTQNLPLTMDEAIQVLATLKMQIRVLEKELKNDETLQQNIDILNTVVDKILLLKFD